MQEHLKQVPEHSEYLRGLSGETALLDNIREKRNNPDPMSDLPAAKCIRLNIQKENECLS